MAIGKFVSFRRLLSLSFTRRYAVSAQNKKKVCKPDTGDIGQRVKLVSEILGLSDAKGRDLISKNAHLQTIDPVRLKRTVSFLLNDMKIPAKSILGCPEILQRLPFSIEQQYHSLVELGLHPVGMPEILRFDYLMNQTPEKMIRIKLLRPDADPVGRLLRAAGDAVDGTAIAARHPKLASKIFQRIRRVILGELLFAKLGCSRTDAERLLRDNPGLVQRSLGLVRDTIDMLTGEFRFPVSAILRHEYILLSDPDSMRRIRATLLDALASPPPASTNLPAFLRRFPRILECGPDCVAATAAILREYGISGQQIARCGHVFVLRHTTVRPRLARIFASPLAADLKSGGSFRDILPLVFRFRQAWPRLLRENASPAPPNVVLWQSQRRRRIMWGQESALRNDTVDRVAERLDRPREDVGAALLVRDYDAADWSKADPLTAVNVLNLLLLERGFSVQQVMNALPIVLQDRHAVASTLDELADSEHLALFDDWMANPYILQLALYSMSTDVVSKGAEGANAGGEVKGESGSPEDKVESRTLVDKVESRAPDGKIESKAQEGKAESKKNKDRVN